MHLLTLPILTPALPTQLPEIWRYQYGDWVFALAFSETSRCGDGYLYVAGEDAWTPVTLH